MHKHAFLYGIAMTAGVAVMGFGVVPQRPRLIWNASKSAPLGLYWLDRASHIKRGELVLAEPPLTARKLAAARGYLPAYVPLVKTIAADHGDVVCSVGMAILINGRVAVRRLKSDSRGRVLPHWTGCRSLGPDDFFLLMETVPASFDGRYFGVISRKAVIGRLTPLWIW